MVQLKNSDFVKVDFDIYANGKLVQTTSEEKGKKAGLQIKHYGAETLILGKAFVLKALDEAILKKDKDSLELTADKAYGKRQKELIKTFTKSAFDEQNMRAVPGMTYDFNGMYGTVRSVVGGRVMVDFNNPLAGKDIKLDYNVVSKVDKIEEQVKVVFEAILRIPNNLYAVSAKEKNLTIKVPAQLIAMKDQLTKSLEELIPQIKDYKVKLEVMENK